MISKYILALGVACSLVGNGLAQSDNVRKALSYRPVQSNVEYDRPTAEESSKCKLVSAKKIGKSGFVLVDDNGQVLRMFINNGGDENVDQWSYFVNGIEVYRDLDTDFDGRADQFRWFGTAGSKWGQDLDGDNQIDKWRAISPEELSAEIVEAIKTRNEKRFIALLLTDQEVDRLGMSEEHAALVKKRLLETRAGFSDRIRTLKSVTAKTKWVHFGGVQPAVIPAGDKDSTKDMTVYDNVAAVIQTAGEHGQLAIGTLVKIDNVWRAIDLPVLVGEKQDAPVSLFLTADDRFLSVTSAIAASSSTSNAELQKHFKALEDIEKEFDAAHAKNDSKLLARINEKRANVIKEIVVSLDDAKQKSDWIRQFADTVAGAYQAGEYPDGLKSVSGYYAELKSQKAAGNDLGYVMYRMISARYSKMFEEADREDVAKVQEQYLEDLEEFVDVYPNVDQAADAMLQLALWAEFSSADDSGDAEKWYSRIATRFPKSETAAKAKGALLRLKSIGKKIDFAGPILDSKKQYRLVQDQGKIVLIHYWASGPDMDYALLERLFKKYRRQGFNIVSVNLDENAETARKAIRDAKLPGIHLFEPGGTESPLSQQLGIAVVPTMILIGKDGKVANRNIRLSELEKSIDKLLK